MINYPLDLHTRRCCFVSVAECLYCFLRALFSSLLAEHSLSPPLFFFTHAPLSLFPFSLFLARLLSLSSPLTLTFAITNSLCSRVSSFSCLTSFAPPAYSSQTLIISISNNDFCLIPMSLCLSTTPSSHTGFCLIPLSLVSVFSLSPANVLLCLLTSLPYLSPRIFLLSYPSLYQSHTRFAPLIVCLPYCLSRSV